MALIGWLMLALMLFYLIPNEYRELDETYPTGCDPIFPAAYNNEHDNYVFKAAMFLSMDE
jgi:hypothetical protein